MKKYLNTSKIKKMKYYATLTTPKGEKINLSNKIDERGCFFSASQRLEGDLESNAAQIVCKSDQLARLNAPNAEKIICSSPLLISVNAPNAIEVCCPNSPLLTSLNALNEVDIYCKDTSMNVLNDAIKLLHNCFDVLLISINGCPNSQLTSINATNLEDIYCKNTINAPNAENVFCPNSQLTSINAPNLAKIYYNNNSQLKVLIEDYGKDKQEIWSQKVGDIIYTYIGCSRLTLEEAIAAINKKYTGKEAADYIDKVKLSQSVVDFLDS